MNFSSRLLTGLLLAHAGTLSAQSQQWTDLGMGVPGVGGVPELIASNAELGRNLIFRVTQTAALAPTLCVIGLNQVNIPVFAGVLVPEPTLTIFRTSTFTGRANYELLLPNLCTQGMMDLYAQVVVLDPVAVQDWSFSNAITATVRNNVPSDFNGDGYSDLAIGVPDENVSGAADAGAINVVYGSGQGLQTANNQIIRQGSVITGTIKGVPEADDRFGTALAYGDFNADGYDDLAVGVPGETTGSATESGTVQVIYGSSTGLQGGLNGRDDLLLRQGLNFLPGTPESFDWFGYSLAAGDLNGDGYDDLAIGAPLENETVGNDGVVHVLFGGSTGLTMSLTQVLVDPITPEADDRFGWSLAAGDVNGDGQLELVAGMPYEDIGNVQDAGAIAIHVWGANGFFGIHFDLDDTWGGVPVPGDAGAFDLFGFSLGFGDFDHNGLDDLVIGAPNDDVGGVQAAGSVLVMASQPGTGIPGPFYERWTQQTANVLGSPSLGDRFGSSFATGDFNDDGVVDLAIGTPEDNAFQGDIGSVNVLFGSGGVGLTTANNELLAYNTIGLGTPSTSHDFGWSLFAGRFGDDCASQLVIGIPGETVNGVQAGAVCVYDVLGGNTEIWSQAPLLGALNNGDRFGGSLVGSPDHSF